MADSTKASSQPQYCCDAIWYPPNNWYQSGEVFNQHFGQPPFLEPGDIRWLTGIFRRLGASSWLGYTRVPRFMTATQVPFQVTPKLQRELSGGMSEVSMENYKWRITLDVNHFAPTEITVSTNEGFLEIEGKHEERQDDHGYIARCFTRKYKLPIGIDVEKIQSTVSGDGILSVEAPLPNVSPPANVIVPVQMEKEAPSLEDRQVESLRSEERSEGERDRDSEETPAAGGEASQSEVAEEAGPEDPQGPLGAPEGGEQAEGHVPEPQATESSEELKEGATTSEAERSDREEKKEEEVSDEGVQEAREPKSTPDSEPPKQEVPAVSVADVEPQTAEATVETEIPAEDPHPESSDNQQQEEHHPDLELSKTQDVEGVDEQTK